jgi:hypothetical protein
MLSEWKITEKELVTAGNRIICKRCTAMSNSSGEQCKKPALKTSRTQKCEFRGGRSTGPRTEAGKARQRAAVTTSGKDAVASCAVKDNRGCGEVRVR